MFSADIQHLLRFGNAADQRAASEWRPKISEPPRIVGGVSGSPTKLIMPSRLDTASLYRALYDITNEGTLPRQRSCAGTAAPAPADRDDGEDTGQTARSAAKLLSALEKPLARITGRLFLH